jgi:type IV pilus assembly protein PilO
VELPKVDLEFLNTVPLFQKVALLTLVVGGLATGFYLYVAEPKQQELGVLQETLAKLDADIQTLTIKVQHLDELIAANKQLEIELAKKKEQLPPEEEAIMLLKQISDLGVRLGLDVRLWKPGAQSEDPSKLFVRMPVSVEVAGGYHTAGLFFDRINKLPRIINVSDLKMGAPRVDQGRVLIQTAFELTAFVAPQEPKPSAAAATAAAK